MISNRNLFLKLILMTPSILLADLGSNLTSLEKLWGSLKTVEMGEGADEQPVIKATGQKGKITVTFLLAEDICYEGVYQYNVDGLFFTPQNVTSILRRTAKNWKATTPVGTLPTVLTSGNYRAVVEGIYISNGPVARRVTVTMPKPAPSREDRDSKAESANAVQEAPTNSP